MKAIEDNVSLRQQLSEAAERLKTSVAPPVHKAEASTQR